MNLFGKRALVTGGTSGIGLAIARRFREAGAHVAVVGRQAERAERIARDEGFSLIVADLASSEGCDEVVRMVAGKPLDILVNNAGVDPAYQVGAPIDFGAIERAIFLNLTAPIRLVTGILEQLTSRPEAAIVNITSGYAIAPSASTPVYCATKAGLRSFTLAVRHQLRDTNVAVIEALPPLVDTPMTSAVGSKGKMSADKCAAAILAAITRGRNEANIGQVGLLRRIESLSPALARRIMIRA